MSNNSIDAENLSGKLLVANPYCSFGDVFDKSIIYVASHTEIGAFGLILNKYVSKFSLKKLYRVRDNGIPDVEEAIYVGGPNEQERSFVIHSSDYNKNTLFDVKDNISVSSNLGIIRDILKGQGPKNATIILGYTGWGANQLEKEIENNYWLILQQDPSLIFSKDNTYSWHSALEKIGVEYSYFSSQMGHS